ncbi:MAG TPA: hypothetical protein VN937_15035 [Blastocatellia bacterium]|nr:hypothetical protein [Blastocatellia bacterium]
MGEFIGVMSPLQLSDAVEFDLDCLKQAALLFDRVAMPGLSIVLKNSSVNFPDDLLNELNWLIQRSILYEPSPVRDSAIIKALIRLPEFRHSFELFRQAFTEAKELAEHRFPEPDEMLINSGGVTLLSEYGEEAFSDLYKLLDRNRVSSACFARMVSIQLRELDTVRAVPILDDSILLDQQSGAFETNVVQIVLKSLPMPDGSVSWDQIRDYRDDPETRSKFWALKDWMNDVARAQLAPHDIEDKLQFLITRFEEHLKLHKLKANYGALETILEIGVGFVENLAKFQLEKAVGKLFTLRQRHIRLMEAELTSPGNEIAYIVKARERFQ